MVNAVTNMAHSVGTTDIPDWNYVEAGVEGFNSDSLKIMFEKSPIAHVATVTTPTLIIAGTADKRCPPTQSYEYYFKLKEHGCTTRLLKYPGAGHGILEAEQEADYLINTLMWFFTNQK
jgi:acylaminoacyl-peptidase